MDTHMPKFDGLAPARVGPLVIETHGLGIRDRTG
jgi:hypothetical protein